MWPGVEGLALASASQVYPRLLNGDSVVRMAESVATEALAHLEQRTGTLEADTPDLAGWTAFAMTRASRLADGPLSR